MISKEVVFIEEMSNGYVNLFKVGAFWRAYEHSALYLHKIMGYKLTLDFTSGNRVGIKSDKTRGGNIYLNLGSLKIYSFYSRKTS